MKPTNEELFKAYEILPDWGTFQQNVINLANWAMDKALEGMIPAANAVEIPAVNAVEIPPESEWPKEAHCVAVVYSTLPAEQFGYFNNLPPIAKVPRSKPAWRPETGKPYAFWDFDGGGGFISTMNDADQIISDNGIRWQHCAKIESIDDIGHDVAWFKANRPWV